MRGYIPGQDNHPKPPRDLRTEHSVCSTDHADPSIDDDECEHEDKEAATTTAKKHHGTSRTVGSSSLCQQHGLTEIQDADMQDALRLARFHPCVTAVYGLPSYAKPTSYGLTS